MTASDKPCHWQTHITLIWLVLLGTHHQAMAQKAVLLAGPMLGYSDYREVAVWVQLTAPGKVSIAYRPVANTASKLVRTQDLATGEGNMLSVKVYPLEPGVTYAYAVYVNGKEQKLAYRAEFKTQPLWAFRTEPPVFTMAIGSCYFVNDSIYDRPKPYGSDYNIIAAVAQAKPDLMLWLGDNTYYREVDFASRNGLIYRQSHTRSQKVLQPLLASTHNYAVWDDHDYGPNDASRCYTFKNDALDVFKMYWPNPNYGVPGGCAGTFGWGDVQVITLDDRWWRAPNRDTSSTKEYFGAVQLQWLKDQLKDSQATFKIIANGGQLLNPAAVFENLAAYPKEYQAFLAAIEESQASGVFMLSGDRHHTELTRLDRQGRYPLYDLTCSSLTAGVAAPGKDERNTARVEGTLLNEHNFALLTFTGPRTERVMRISIRGVDGAEKWTRDIAAKDLRLPKVGGKPGE